MPDRSGQKLTGVISASVLLRQTEAVCRRAPDVVLGLSGGVDSGVAAELLVRQGYSVCGALLRIPGADCPREDALAVAQAADIPLFELDVGEAFERIVLRNFAREYAGARTPNPCIVCNPGVKFAALCELADELGAPFVASGHYAGVRTAAGRAELLRHASGKDQSYMLYRLPQSQLGRLLLPLQQMGKASVRELAREWALPVAQKRDSQDICFVPQGDYAAVLERLGVPMAPGDFVDGEGRVLGRHEGIARYTVGQRKGLGVSADQRLFVTKIDAFTRRVTLQGSEALLCSRLALSDVVWTSGEAPKQPVCATVKLRLGPREHAARVQPLGERGALVLFDRPVRRGAPGQSAVFYDGDMVLGGGVIDDAAL